MPRPWASEQDGARGRRPWLALGCLLAVVLLTWALAQGRVLSGGHGPDRASLPRVSLTQLPPEAAHTVDLIRSGGPYPYPRDGIVFHNYEGLLPDEPSGYYHEYTVPTPGAADRGARRIIVGSAGELYWTADHYRTFERISP